MAHVIVVRRHVASDHGYGWRTILLHSEIVAKIAISIAKISLHAELKRSTLLLCSTVVAVDFPSL